MRVSAKRGRWLFSALGLLGITAVFAGSALLVFFHRIVQFFMHQELILKPGNEFFDLWSDVPVDVHQKIYLFNITNPEQFVNGSKPVVQELGPYVFRGRWRKERMDWDDEAGTVTYRDVKEYVFDPELSSGRTLEDRMYTLNAPLLAVVNYVEELAPFLMRSFLVDIMNGIFRRYNETLLVHRTIRELVYEGYHEPMVADLVKVVEPFMTLPMQLINDTFGILHERKHVGDGVFTIKSGLHGLDDYTSIQAWNNKSSVRWWDGDSCNLIIGTDGVQYGPGVTRDRKLNFFNPNLCRSLPLLYERDVTVHGIRSLRFGMPPDTFAYGEDNPENGCYCSGEDCRSGILPVRCKKGAPYVLSFPHFLNGEVSLTDAVEGVDASTEEHGSYIDVEPVTGFTINAAFRMQLNGVTRHLPEYETLKYVNEHIIPVIWISEEAQLDADFASYFRVRVQIPILVFRIVCIVTIIIGTFWALSSVVFFLCIRTRVKPDNVTLKTLYTNVATWPVEEAACQKTHL